VRPLRISHLSIAFVATVALLATLLGIYMWNELEVVTRAVEERERQVAREEVIHALKDLQKEVFKIGRQLAEWEETRQHLAFDDYYPIWRDSRVRNTGVVPPNVDTVALYNKQRKILLPSPEWNPMPDQLPLDVDWPLLMVTPGSEQDHHHVHLYLFNPIYADPSEEVLLGYYGVKFDLLGDLTVLRKFRYADITDVKTSVEHRYKDLSEAINLIHYKLLPNPSLQFIHEVFKKELVQVLLFVIAILSFAFFLLHRLMVRPLRAISQEIDTLQGASDNLSTQLTEGGNMPLAELEHVRQSFSNYQHRLAELHNNLEQSSRDFYRQARQDALTGSYNRRALEEDWHSQKVGCFDEIALLLFDCDHFKSINDTFGHDVGDAVLEGVAHNIEMALRADDRLYRLGGDEFATLLLGADKSQAGIIAERCLEKVQGFDFRKYGLPEPLSISIGLAISSGQESLSELQKRADLAMYAAKKPGNKKVVAYREELGEVASLVSNRSINAVYRAIEDPTRFELHYQDIVSLPIMEPDYVEALARIRIDGEIFRPADIFPIVETRRLDVEFDMAVIEAIGADFHSGRLTKDRGVSINVSAPGIVHAKVISSLLELRQREPDPKLVVEITETALITQMEMAAGHIDQLREAGFLVALDDFGSGYSSLRYLASMPVDIVKFDISMIAQLEKENQQQRLITEEMAALVKAAGYKIVAEGIETETMLQRVKGIGFDYVQGFYFGRME